MVRSMTKRRAGSGVSPFRAVTMALAGTLGVGNIVGVANAIWIGGAGAVFWMWVSALIAMILKYAEIVLAVSHRRRGRGGVFGGAYYYIKDHFFSRGRLRAGLFWSSVFAALMILNALSMGCIIQVNAIDSALSGVASVPSWLTGTVLVALILPFVVKGSQKISTVTEWLVPIMSGGYVVLSVAVLYIRAEYVGDAIRTIFSEAFSFDSMTGGTIGFLLSKSVRIGTMRGLLSNEAGCGTAPTAHASADTESPAAQGVWGVFEVFVDTILLCTATALVILVSPVKLQAIGADAVMMTVRAYSSVLGGWSDWFFVVAIFCFGYATALCWANYGLESLRFLTGKRSMRRLYVFLFAVCVFWGVFSAPSSVWTLADFAIAALTTLNLCALVAMRREIWQETEKWNVNKG